MFPLRILIALTLIYDLIIAVRNNNGKVYVDDCDKYTLLFMGIGLLTIVWSCNKEASKTAALVYITAIIVLMQIKARSFNEETKGYLLDAIYINMVLMGFAALYECLNGTYLTVSYEYYYRTYNIFGMIRPKAAFYNTNNLAVFYMLSLPFGVLATERWAFQNIFKIAIIVFSGIIIILTGSRMGLIAILLFIALYFLYKVYSSNKSKKFLLIIVFLFASVAFIYFVPKNVWSIFEGTNISDEGRWEIWKGAVNACRHYFLLGSGIGTSKYAYGSLGSTHNYSLEILLEFGLIGFVTFAVIIRKATPSLYDARNNEEYAYLRISFWMFLLCSICASSLQGFYYLWMYWGLSLAMMNSMHTNE